MCPDCRRQRRLLFRNERTLYRGNCDLCKKSFISTFPANAPFPVYCSDCWWSDNWDPLEYGRDFDFNRPFFEQFKELNLAVPKPGTFIYRCENCDYNSLQGLSRNTYMSPGSYCMEDCIYVRKSQYCKDCVDGMLLDHCELTYEGVSSKNCYDCNYIFYSALLSQCEYMFGCESCKNCFMCSDLKRGDFCVMNREYNPAEYSKKVAEIKRKSSRERMDMFMDLVKTVPKRAVTQINCENCVGDQLFDCKNVYQGYDNFRLEDCRYIHDSSECKDMMDIDVLDKVNELCYMVVSGGDQCSNDIFCFCPVYAQDTIYCFDVWQCQKMFGCSSISKKFSHCILNKRYSKEEYEKLVARIIEHMKSTGEWGQFFPPDISPYGYNETTASDFFPLSKTEAVKRGFKWSEIPEQAIKVEKSISADKLPDDIKLVPDDILNWAVVCEATGKPYKIQQQELGFYRKKGLPIPHIHPDMRYAKRFAMMKPARLYSRACAKCGTLVQTTYSPDRPEKVYCEYCYLKEVY
jgi:hypothetical protein